MVVGVVLEVDEGWSKGAKVGGDQGVVMEGRAATKGGAVMLLRSPLIVAMEARNSFNVDLFEAMELFDMTETIVITRLALLWNQKAALGLESL